MTEYFILDLNNEGKIIDKIHAENQQEAINKWAEKQNEFVSEGWLELGEGTGYGVVAKSNMGQWQPTSKSWADEYR